MNATTHIVKECKHARDLDGMLCKVDGANTNTLLKTNTLKSCIERIVLYTLKLLRFGFDPT